MSTNPTAAPATEQEPVTTGDEFTPIGDATYSPEDNKLRLYPHARLDTELYERVKLHGFRWAPKQQLFVAPMWTPARFDLLIELCGEVGDEDRSLMDRAEAKSERIEARAERREQEADRAHAGVKAISDNIPFGQPILVGHHSERRARKDAEKIQRGMDKAVKLWESAKYWAARADDAIHHAKYKEQPSVRARRIKTIEADRRKKVREQDEARADLAKWSTPGLTLEAARNVANYSRLYVARGEHGPWSAWDVLRPDEDRYKACPAMTVQQVVEIAQRSIPKSIARAQRWIDHFDLRLAYERAMLGEQGGTTTDRKGPEVGGAVKCWASPGYGKGWSYIVKVNKVSVSILDTFNGTDFFRRTMPLDKITAVLTKAEVESAREQNKLHGETEKGFFLVDGKPAPRPTPEPPTAEATERDAAFEGMKATVKAGVQVATGPDLFPTPVELADRMVDHANLQPGDVVLEPSAGTGNLLAAAARAVPGLITVAVELDQRMAAHLAAHHPNVRVECADFLALTPERLGQYDVILTNPPFSKAQDIAHILHARQLLKPGGRLVAICANGPRQQAQLKPLATEWYDLPAGTFKETGTNVNTALLVIEQA